MRNIIQRVSFSIFALFVISFLLFLLTNVVPGSPATAVLDVDASIEEIQSWERDHNLHLPVTHQYWIWLTNTLSGDFGVSFITERDIAEEITDTLPVTLEWVGLGFALAIILGISDYLNVPEAKFADKDAEMFLQFSENILGINSDNIKLLINEKASRTEITKAIKLWLKSKSYDNSRELYLFYAGHGIINPKNNLSFFQGCVVKYVCRYLQKNGIEDLEKIKHYCDLEIKKLKDTK
mgnify:CR=1 FL=1